MTTRPLLSEETPKTFTTAREGSGPRHADSEPTLSPECDPVFWDLTGVSLVRVTVEPRTPRQRVDPDQVYAPVLDFFLESSPSTRDHGGPRRFPRVQQAVETRTPTEGEVHYPTSQEGLDRQTRHRSRYRSNIPSRVSWTYPVRQGSRRVPTSPGDSDTGEGR